jgi:mono/diheme cytochrome c family protein
LFAALPAAVLGGWLTSVSAAEPDRGELLAGLAGCLACHTAEGGVEGAGGHAVVTSFGTFYGSNLTADVGVGLGGWTLEQFDRALRLGRDPSGRPYYPAFPYTSFTRLLDADVAALWRWVQGLPAEPRVEEPHEVKPRYRGRAALGIWRSLAFRPGEFQGDPERSAAWNLGAYLVEGPGHCGECHTPRSGIGVPLRRRALQGSDAPVAPDISAGPEGVGGWSVDELVDFLDLGMLPDGDFTGGEMSRIVEQGTARLSAEEREAIALYLLDRDAR